jgi:hypothetical protein
MMNFKRLQHMTPQEIAHRLRERMRRETDRLRFRAGSERNTDDELAMLIDRHGSSLKSYFQSEPAVRFYASTHDRPAAADFIRTNFPDWLERTIQQAGVLCEHRIDILTFKDISLEGDIDWNRDPISGFQWPRRYWADYDLIHHAPADAKIIHELNRHQHLPRLAKAFFLTGDEPYASEAVGQMESWIEQNPKWHGVNWQSSLELAIRCISWLWTLVLLLPSESLTESSLRRICKSLFAQLDHIYRYPSTYTSPNTHLIGEASALLMAGILFSELPRSSAWRDFGSHTLVREMQRQVPEDGVYCELSSYYHSYVVDFYLQVLTLSQRNSVFLPDWVWNRLSRMVEFVMYLTRPDGTIPLLGDDDGGRALALASTDYRCFADGLCSAAVTFARGDFKFQAGGFREESFWLFGPEAWPTFNSLPAKPPSEMSRIFQDSGYCTQRSGWGKGDTHVTFDFNGLGSPSGGHGHADALSITMFSNGHDFIIDPGTSVYNAAPNWRKFFRSTSAHNTVVVDGMSQSKPGHTFAWKTKANVRLRQQIALSELDYVDAEHDGFTAATGITHRRRLVFVRPNYWILLDDLCGRGEHDISFLYHFAAEAKLAILGDEKRGDVDCRASIGAAGLQLMMYGSDATRAEAVCGEKSPIQGWASLRYGDRHPSPVLKASMTGPAPVSMMSFLVPTNEPVQSWRIKANRREVLAAAIRDREFDDIAVMSSEDGDLRLLDFAMRGEFFWMRMAQGKLCRLLAVNAYSFSYAGDTVFEYQQPGAYVHAYLCQDGMMIERGDRKGELYVRDLRDRQFQRH